MIFGISGYARSGKDTFGETLVKKLAEYGIKAKTYAFATVLKQNLDPFLINEFNISAFTKDNHEKQLIRPLLVSYGEAKRNLNSNYWIENLKNLIDNSVFPVITDVRYLNEADWINSNNGFLLNLNRQKPDGSFIEAPNEQELLTVPEVKEKSAFNLTWQTIEDQNLIDEVVESFIISVLKDLIPLWKATFPL